MNGTSAVATPEQRAAPEPSAAPLPASQPGTSPQPTTGLPALQAGAGNAALAAAATNGSPPPYGDALSLQSTYGNAAVARSFPQPQAAAQPAPGVATTPVLIVEDTVEAPGPGQMKKSDFLAELQTAVCKTAAEALAGTPWSEKGCPYIERWFGYYQAQDAQHVERAVRRYAPETTGATSAQDYIRIISEHIRSPIDIWAKTGRITGVPEDLPVPTTPTAGPPTSGNLPGSTTAPSVAPIMPKARDGGVRGARDPQAIQAQLGAGGPLEADVQTRMGAAFGQDFSHVRVHADSAAGRLSSELNARAFTVGEHVAFGEGTYQPGTLMGDALIAHELAHVMQQRGRASGSARSLEADADRAAAHAVAPGLEASSLIAHLRHHDNANEARSGVFGLRLQRCGDSVPDYSRAPAPPKYDETVKALRDAYTAADKLRTDKGATASQIQAAQDRISSLEADLSLLGVRLDPEALMKAVIAPGKPKDLRNPNPRIVREPSGPLAIGQRMTFKLLVDYLPPNEKASVDWGWKAPEIDGGALYRSEGILYDKTGSRGLVIELDETFWGIGSHEHTPSWRQAGKFKPTATLKLGDKSFKAPEGDWIPVLPSAADRFEIEAETPVALVGGPAVFRVKGWVPSMTDYLVDWRTDEGVTPSPYPYPIQFRPVWSTPGKHSVTAKLLRNDAARTVVREAPAVTVDIQDPLAAAQAVLAGPKGVPIEAKPPKALSAFKESSDRAMAEIGTRAKMGGSAQEYWEDRLKALAKREKTLRELEPDYEKSQLLPKDLAVAPEGTYSVSLPAVIVYPSQEKAAIQPISIYLRITKSGNSYSARLLDVTGKKVIKFDGAGNTAVEAAAAAFNDWKSDNPYPTGGQVVYHLDFPGWKFDGSFSTYSTWKRAKEWVDGIIAVGGLIVGALLLAAPEATITKVLGLALMALAVARGGVAIVENIDLGYGALSEENVLEGVMILTAALGGGGSLLRAAGAEVRMAGAVVREVRPMMLTVGKYTVFTVLGLDVGTFVYATKEAIQALSVASADPTKTADEQRAEMFRILGSLFLNASLLFVSNRGMVKESLSGFVKSRAPKGAGTAVTLDAKARLDLELELRKANFEPEKLKAMSHEELLDAYQGELTKQKAAARLEEIRGTLSEEGKAELDALRKKHGGDAKAVGDELDATGKGTKEYLEGLATEKKAAAEKAAAEQKAAAEKEAAEREANKRRRFEEMKKRAAEKEEERKKADKAAVAAQAEKDRAVGKVSAEAERLALDAAKKDPKFDASRAPVVGEEAVKAHLGHAGETGVKMPEFGYWRTDGTFVTVEVKNQNHPDSGHAREKFETVAKFGNETPPSGSGAREPKRAFVLQIPDWWSGTFADANHKIVGGTLHDLTGPILIDGVPIEVLVMPFPKP